MAGEIKVGMEFGNYNKMTEKMKRKYDTESKTDNGKMQSEYIFFNRGKKNIVGQAYREALHFNEYGESVFIDAVLFSKGYQYGTSDNDWEKMDKFDYIQGKSQYALDFNGNGKVDENEIFDGDLDRHAYKNAKISGDLNNYMKYHSSFEY